MKTPFKIIPQINDSFTRWLLDTMRATASTMIYITTKQLHHYEIFEALVPIEHQATLHEAGIILSCNSTQYISTQINYNNKIVNLELTIAGQLPLPKLLLPNRLNLITENSKLLEYLTPSLFIAIEWATLIYVTERLIGITNNRTILTYLFPWLPDVIKESGWIFIPNEDAKEINWKRLTERKQWYANNTNIGNKIERYNCDRTFLAALNRKPLVVPIALTNDIRNAATSGLKLFTQYRLAKERTVNKVLSTIIPICNTNLVDTDIIKDLDDIEKLYIYDKQQRGIIK